MTDDSTFIPPVPTPGPAPIPTYVPARPKSPLGPILIGFFTVIILSGLLGFFYFKAKFTASDNVEPSPTPVVTASPSPEPSVTPAELVPEPSNSVAKGSAKPTLKPVSAIKPIKSPTPTPTPTQTPTPQATLDIRFGNPSAVIKQTIDEGTGDGRVINREYTSIQSGQFDEVSSTWSPRVTVCYHIVSNEAVAGKDIKFNMSLDDKVEVEDNLGQYDKLEAGRLYDWCRDTSINIGKHTARLTINTDKAVKESNYTNNVARIDWENLADKIAPNFTLMGPNNEGTDGTCLFPQYISDNVTAYKDLKIEQKVDLSGWSKYDGNRYCFKGEAKDSHSYRIRISDTRGNVNEQNKTFVLY